MAAIEQTPEAGGGAAGVRGGWRPSLGAWCGRDGTNFRVWAPLRQRVELLIEEAGVAATVHPLTRAPDGTFGGFVPGVGAGSRYRYRLDGAGPYPDPASRYQPEGVHGPSEVVDASRFGWGDVGWSGVSLDDLVLYELHAGTFTPEGTFAGVIERLPYLRDLGVTAIELMPVADFPGLRNWGYDGVCLFAPARCYGRPDDLRRLVDCAHRYGLAVILDVVYNHFGPDGAYLGNFSPYYFSRHHHTPWGPALNLDGTHAGMVRAFFVENALHWLHEYHLDGLRFDATHALIDDSPRHLLAELSGCVRTSVAGRGVLLIAEDHRNLADMVRPEAEGGWGLDAVWADDFHHQVRRHLAGDCEGYYRDFTGSTADIAATARQGWFYCGQHSTHLDSARGTDPAGLPLSRFVVCLQNHDQVGNRAFGERLHHQIDLAAYHAATALLLCAPETPLLFMGQEWAASTPFLFFTDHHPELGKLVTKGRRREFQAFSAFTDPKMRERIPDPQAAATFGASQLVWAESEREPHAATLRLYRALLRLRRAEPALRAADPEGCKVVAAGEDALILVRTASAAAPILLVVRLRGAGVVRAELAGFGDQGCATGDWDQVLGTEDPVFAAEGRPPIVEHPQGAIAIQFLRPGAVIFRGPGATGAPASLPSG